MLAPRTSGHATGCRGVPGIGIHRASGRLWGYGFRARLDGGVFHHPRRSGHPWLVLQVLLRMAWGSWTEFCGIAIRERRER